MAEKLDQNEIDRIAALASNDPRAEAECREQQQMQMAQLRDLALRGITDVVRRALLINPRARLELVQRLGEEAVRRIERTTFTADDVAASWRVIEAVDARLVSVDELDRVEAELLDDLLHDIEGEES